MSLRTRNFFAPNPLWIKTPYCNQCGTNHCEPYGFKIGACFTCGQKGHKANECPKTLYRNIVALPK